MKSLERPCYKMEGKNVETQKSFSLTSDFHVHTPALTHTLTYLHSKPWSRAGGVAHWLEHEPLGFMSWVPCLLPDTKINPEASCLS